MYHVASWHWGKLQELPHTLIACQGCTYMPFGVASAVTNTEHASPWPRPNILDLGGRLSTCTTSWGATRALEKWTLTQPWSFLVFDRFLVCAYSNLLQHHCLGFYRNMLWMAEGPSYLYHSPLMSLQPLSQCETTVHHRKNLASCNMWVNLNTNAVSRTGLTRTVVPSRCNNVCTFPMKSLIAFWLLAKQRGWQEILILGFFKVIESKWHFFSVDSTCKILNCFAQDLIEFWKPEMNTRWFKEHPVLSETRCTT